MEVEPKSTCGSLLLQVYHKLFGDRQLEAEELAFFMQTQKKPEKSGKTISSGGVWMESTAKISDYGIEVTKVGAT